mgnify:CR=1 FL=1
MFTSYSLSDVITQEVRRLQDIERTWEILTARGAGEHNFYKAFHPITRLKGHLHKMHGTRLTRYVRFIYLNPIEGVLISYKTANKFPHQPHNIMHLNQITTLEFMKETKWYFSPGRYYMRV